jgi:MFS family permease
MAVLQWKQKLNRDVVLLLVLWACLTFGNIGIVGVLFSLYLLRMGYSPAFIGQMYGIGQLVWAIFALPAGMIGARFGLKRALVASLLIQAVVISLIPNIPAASFLPDEARTPVMLGVWVFYWISAALATVNSIPYLMSVTDDHSRDLAFSGQQASGALASFVGNLIAGAMPGLLASRLSVSLDDPLPYRLALWLAPPIYLLGALAFSRARSAALPAPQTKSQRGIPGPVLHILALFAALIVLQTISEGALRAFFTVYLDTDLRIPTVQIGGIMGVSQLLPIGFLMLTPALIRRFGTGAGLGIMTLVSAAFMLLLAGVPAVGAAAIGFMGMMSSVAMINAIRSGFSQEIVPQHWRATSSAVSTIGNALGWSSASWMGSFLARPVGFRGLFLISALLTMLSAGLVFLRFRKVDTMQESGLPAAAIPLTGKKLEEE